MSDKLRVKGKLTTDKELSRVVDSLLQLYPEKFTPLCLQLSCEELLARLSQ